MKNMKGSIPRRYARALIELAKEGGSSDLPIQFGQVLEKMAAIFQESPKDLHTLADDLLSLSGRMEAMGEIADRLSCPPLLKNFLLLLVKKGRIIFLPAIAREYERLCDEILGIVRVVVETPKMPEAALLQKVETILAKRLNKKIILKGESHPEILGGVVLKIDHTIYDGSVRNELERMREKILMEV